MIRSELRTIVTGNVGRTDKDSLINEYFILGLFDAMTRHEWGDLKVEADLTINADTTSLNLTKGLHFYDFRVISGTNSQELVIVSNSSTSHQRELSWYPKSDASYTLRYTYQRDPDYVEDTLFNIDSDHNPIQILDNALISFATGYLFNSLEQFQSGQIWMQKYEVDLAKAISFDERNPVHNRRFQPHQPLVDMSRVSPNYWNDPFVGHSIR